MSRKIVIKSSNGLEPKEVYPSCFVGFSERVNRSIEVELLIEAGETIDHALKFLEHEDWGGV